MAGVGDQLPFAVEGGLQAGEHVVERGGEAGDFVAAGRDIQAAVRGQGGRLGAHPFHGAQSRGGEQVGAGGRDDEHQG